MADLKIRVFKGRESVPETTVTVPGSVLKIASKLIPKRAAESLQDKGIDLDEIIKLAENPEARGTLVEVEDEEERADRHRSRVAGGRSAGPVAPPGTASARPAWREESQSHSVRVPTAPPIDTPGDGPYVATMRRTRSWPHCSTSWRVMRRSENS
jgi:hypothetical protein